MTAPARGHDGHSSSGGTAAPLVWPLHPSSVMQRKALRFGKGFRVAITAKGSQAAEMVIPPGDAEGGPGNRHRGADQWLFVISGTGYARVKGRRHPLRAGVLVLIEHGEEHEVRNTGRTLLKTLNLYVPPAYDEDGEELPRGKR